MGNMVYRKCEGHMYYGIKDCGINGLSDEGAVG